MADQFSANEVSSRAWALHRPNGVCRSALVFLEQDGRILGYHHPNEAGWAMHGDGLAFLSPEGRITSISSEIQRTDSGALEIRMVHPDSAKQPAHVLLEIADPRAQLRRAELRESSWRRGLLVPRPREGSAGHDTAGMSLEVSVPSAARRFLDSELSRVFFIANNPDIPAHALADLQIHASDILIQYNRPLHFDSLKELSCHRVHFMYPNEKSCWGFSDQGQPDLPYDSQSMVSLTFALAIGTPDVVVPYFQALQGRAGWMTIVPDWHIALHSYPFGKMPSCGFISIGFFRSLNWLRRQLNREPLELIPVGFTGHYKPGQAWVGHDFAFEQNFYRTCLDLRQTRTGEASQ